MSERKRRSDQAAERAFDLLNSDKVRA